MAKRALKVVVPTEPIKLDLGAGKNKKEGFLGVDRRKFEGIDVVTDLTKKWPWKDETVGEIHASHVLEHFTGVERVQVFNEMYRVLQKGAKATIITPSWASSRAYGDFTHQWPPVSEFLFNYLNKTWRHQNAPDNDIEWNPQGYNCDFDHAGGYGLHPHLQGRNTEYQTHAITFWKEAASDIITTLTKR
jgi:Methyltransferase domain